MLASVLEKAGFEIHLLDACAVKKRRCIADIVKQAIDLRPDVIGMTLLTPMVKDAYKLASALKAKGFKIIAGGPHATLAADEVISHDFDAVVLGEGEPVIEQTIKAVMGQIPIDTVTGIVYKNSHNQPIYTITREPLNDIDSLPFPAHHLVHLSEYGITNGRMHRANIFSSRGCPALCSFCAGGLFGKKFRFRSIKNIIDEIIYLNRTYGTHEFHFVDDAMTVNRERVEEFCESLIQLKMPITWSIMTRVDTIDEEMLSLLSRAGCTQIDYGVESGHSETLKKIHKPHTIEMVRKIIPLTAQYNIKPYVFFILGFPWESRDDIQVTFDLMKELAPHVECFHPAVASILIPFPGTEIYNKYKDQYDFENWWLTDDRHYEHNGTIGQSYFEERLFAYGHVLKADFFYYDKEVKEKIYEIFTFMYKHNIKKSNLIRRLIFETLFAISQKTAALSPSIERALFAPVTMAKKMLSL